VADFSKIAFLKDEFLHRHCFLYLINFKGSNDERRGFKPEVD